MDASILVTVPHAFAYKDDYESHSRDFAALEAAERLCSHKSAILHAGALDRHQDADLNRETTTEASREYHEFIEWWISTHPYGILLDVHSFPSEGFNWKNPTTTLDEDTVVTSDLVILVPEQDNEFALQVAQGRTTDVFQGTRVNKIIHMGCKKSVLLEFRENAEGHLADPAMVDRILSECLS